MLKWIESTGKSEEAAIEAALQKLGMDRDEVSVEVLERAKSGFLGIGSCPAKVKVTYEAPDEPETPAPVETAAPVAEAPAEATADDARAYIGQNVSSLTDALGAPLSSSYAPSCLGPGEDGELIYDGFTVYTYREDGVETVEDVL